MTDLLNRTSDAAESPILDRVYTAIIVSLAAILIALALFRPKAGDVTVNAALNLKQESVGQAVPLSADSLEREIRRPEVVRKLLSGIDPNVLGESGDPVNSWWVDSVAQSISVDAELLQPSEEGMRLILTSKGESEPFQLALLGQVQEYLESTYHQPSGSENSQTETRSRENVAIAVEQLDSLQTELKAYSSERIEQAREKYRSELRAAVHRFVQSRRNAGNGFASGNSKKRKMPVITAVNPDWKEIEAELVRLREGESDNQIHSMNSHGQFDDAVDQIAKRIKSTRQTVVVDNGIIENPFFKKKQAEARQQRIETAIDEDLAELDDQAIDEIIDLAMQTGDQSSGIENPWPSSTPQPSNDARSQATLRVSSVLAKMPPFDELAVRREVEKEPQFRDLVAKFNAARDARDTALASLDQQAPSEKSVVSVVSNLESPKVVKYTRNFSRSFVLRMLAPCLLLGLLCGVLTTAPQPPETFISPEDAENWLDFPVVGKISTGDGPVIEAAAAPATPGYVKVLRRICEGIVCLSLVAVLFAVMSVSGFGREFLGNPLSGFTEAVDHITSWVS